MKINQALILKLSGIFIILGMIIGGIGFVLSGPSLNAYQTGSQKWYRTFQLGPVITNEDAETEIRQEIEELKEERAELKNSPFDKDTKEDLADIQEDLDHLKDELQELR